VAGTLYLKKVAKN